MISSLVSNQMIVEEASKALVLCLTPTDSLSDKEKKTKLYLIHIRNRAFQSLGKKCANKNFALKEHAKTLTNKILIAKSFFEKIGKKEEESQISDISMFNLVQKSIDDQISSAILLMAKPESECSDKERLEKAKQKELQNEILKATREKIKEQKDTQNVIEKNLEELLKSLSN